MDVRFTPSARTQFIEAITTIRRHNPSAARKFRERAGKSLHRLRRFPESGAPVQEFPDLPFREVYVTPYRFFYRIAHGAVWVVAVWHGAQIPREPQTPPKPATGEG